MQRFVAIVVLLMFCWPAPRLVLHSHENSGDNQAVCNRFIEHLTTHHSGNAVAPANPAEFHLHWSFPNVDDVVCNNYAFAYDAQSSLSGDSIVELVSDLLNCSEFTYCGLELEPLSYSCRGVSSLEHTSKSKVDLLPLLTKWNC